MRKKRNLVEDSSDIYFGPQDSNNPKQIIDKNCKIQFEENDIIMNTQYNDDTMIVKISTNSNCLTNKSYHHINGIIYLSYYTLLDNINDFPIIDWSDKEKFGENYFYNCFLSYNQEGDELRKKFYSEEKYFVGCSRDNEIENFIDRYSMVDIISTIFFDEVLCNKDNFDYKHINISTTKNKYKSLELTYQSDINSKERRIFINDKDGKVIRECTIRNEYLDNDIIRRIIEVSQDDYKITIEVDGHNIDVLSNEIKLFLRLFEFFPINANIDWVWNGISQISFNDPPNNYASVKLNFYKNMLLIGNKEWNNPDFKVSNSKSLIHKP